jgi:glyoxylase-like metal-dependent hydrolase (beta-lactamase superfamily II)
MQIEPGVYLVGSGRFGFDLTHACDCNIYLFDAGDGYVLFDAGVGLGSAEILAVCQRDGVETGHIRHLFLTHAHGDHGGGAAPLRGLLALTIYASASTAQLVSVADEQALSLPAARASGLYPKDYVYRPCPVDHILRPGEIVTIGALRVEQIPTPGHSHDHTSYLVTHNNKRYLVSGDAIFFGGKVVWQNTYDCSVPETNASILRLAHYEFAALLPGHLNFSLRNGKRHVLTASALIDRLGCPPSIA